MIPEALTQIGESLSRIARHKDADTVLKGNAQRLLAMIPKYSPETRQVIYEAAIAICDDIEFRFRELEGAELREAALRILCDKGKSVDEVFGT